MSRAGRLVTIGSFDGVHRGHRALIERTVREARARRLIPTAVTFHVPPKMIIDAKSRLSVLTTPDEKAVLLKRAGIEEIHVVRFSRRFAHLRPFRFFRSYLLEKLRAKGLVIGLDFRFGERRSAGAVELVRWGQEFEIPVWAIPPVKKGRAKISSTRIRQALAQSDYSCARELLGHPYIVSGVVRRGRGVGRALGFRTANIASPREKILPAGVYAVTARIGRRGQRFENAARTVAGVCNIGSRPTLGAGGRLLTEVHLFDFTGDLVGRPLVVELVKKLRAERRFANTDALVRQIRMDAAQARRFLANRDRGR